MGGVRGFFSLEEFRPLPDSLSLMKYLGGPHHNSEVVSLPFGSECEREEFCLISDTVYTVKPENLGVPPGTHPAEQNRVAHDGQAGVWVSTQTYLTHTACTVCAWPSAGTQSFGYWSK